MNDVRADLNWTRVLVHMKHDEIIRCLLRRGDTMNRMRRLAVLVTELTESSLAEDRAFNAWRAAGSPLE